MLQFYIHKVQCLTLYEIKCVCVMLESGGGGTHLVADQLFISVTAWGKKLFLCLAVFV